METNSAQTVGLINRTTVFIRLPIGGYSYAGSRQADRQTDRQTEIDRQTDRQTDR